MNEESKTTESLLTIAGVALLGIMASSSKIADETLKIDIVTPIVGKYNKTPTSAIEKVKDYFQIHGDDVIMIVSMISIFVIYILAQHLFGLNS